MSRNHSDRDDHVRGILRRGDPAAGDGLTTDEIHAMRRSVLNAAPDSPRRSLVGPVLVATCAALFYLSVWWVGKVERMWEAPREASVPPPAAVPPALPEPAPVASIAESVPPPPVSVRSTRRRAPQPAPRREEIALHQEPHTRQIQFSTPGGTRVIWVLTTEDVL